MKERESSQGNYDILELKSGEKFIYEDLIDKITSGDILMQIIGEEKEHSGFQWEKLLPRLNIEFTDLLIEKITSAIDFDAADLADLGMMLYQKGSVDTAKKIAYRALEKSKPVGWIRHYDGGSKIKPFELMQLIEEPAVVRQLIIKDLAFNFKELGAKQLVDEILPVLKIMVPADSKEYAVIYKEIENYTCALFETATVEQKGFRFVEAEGSGPELFSRFLLFIFEIPVSTMKEQIEAIMVACYNSSSHFVHLFLDRLYENKYYESFLSILNGIWGVKHEQIGQYKDKIVSLASHARFDIVASAKKLLQETGVQVEWAPSNSPLPLVYVMEFENRPELIVDQETRLKRIVEDGGLRDTNDPIEFIGYYNNVAKALSRESKIPVLNIAHRIMQLTKEEKLPAWYDQHSEKQLTAFLDSVQLKVSYARPRMIKLPAAIARVVNELWNGGAISLGNARLVCDNNEPLICSIVPVRRPEFIPPLLKKEYKATARYYDFNEKWVEELNPTAFDQLAFLHGDKCVIAESSKIKSFSDGWPGELRKSFISYYQEIDQDDHHFFASSLYNLMISEYTDEENDENELIFANFVNSFDPRRNWLAINPVYCIGAGWKLADDGLFRWLNAEGNIMVESFFWMEGNTMNNQRFFESQGGYGWYVLASVKAIEELIRIYQSPIFVQKKVERKYRFVQKRFNTDIDAKKVIFNTGMIEPTSK